MKWISSITLSLLLWAMPMALNAHTDAAQSDRSKKIVQYVIGGTMIVLTLVGGGTIVYFVTKKGRAKISLANKKTLKADGTLLNKAAVPSFNLHEWRSKKEKEKKVEQKAIACIQNAQDQLDSINPKGAECGDFFEQRMKLDQLVDDLNKHAEVIDNARLANQAIAQKKSNLDTNLQAKMHEFQEREKELIENDYGKFFAQAIQNYDPQQQEKSHFAHISPESWQKFEQAAQENGLVVPSEIVHYRITTSWQEGRTLDPKKTVDLILALPDQEWKKNKDIALLCAQMLASYATESAFDGLVATLQLNPAFAAQEDAFAALLGLAVVVKNEALVKYLVDKGADPLRPVGAVMRSANYVSGANCLLDELIDRRAHHINDDTSIKLLAHYLNAEQKEKIKQHLQAMQAIDPQFIAYFS